MSTEAGKELLNTYRQQGFLFPLPALSHLETAVLLTKLEELEEQHGGKLPASYQSKAASVLNLAKRADPPP